MVCILVKLRPKLGLKHKHLLKSYILQLKYY